MENKKHLPSLTCGERSALGVTLAGLSVFVLIHISSLIPPNGETQFFVCGGSFVTASFLAGFLGIPKLLVDIAGRKLDNNNHK